MSICLHVSVACPARESSGELERLIEREQKKMCMTGSMSERDLESSSEIKTALQSDSMTVRDGFSRKTITMEIPSPRRRAEELTARKHVAQ